MKIDLLLKNANVIDETGSFQTSVNILLHKGEILDISPEKMEGYLPDTVMDCADLVITPGIPNLHTHSSMTLFRGIAEDVTIDDWFNREIWPYEKNMTENHAYAGTLAAIYEMLNVGVTAFADHYMFPEAILQAVRETGIRADIAPTMFGISNDFEDQLMATKKIIEDHHQPDKGVSIRFGPHSPYTCNPEQLKQVAMAAKEMGVGIHLHVSETKEQVENSIREHGLTPFQVVSEAGVLKLPTIVAHGLWITASDRKLLTPDTTMAVSPKTYMKLAMGSGNLWDRWQELPLAVGTDGAASSNTLNPLEQTQLFGLLGKFLKGDAEGYPCEALWRMLMKGHEALPFHTGKIKAGWKADLVFWDLNSPNTLPKHNPLATILYSSNQQQVKHVMIDGRWVKYQGKVLLDRKRVSELLLAATEELLEIGKGQSSLKF